MCLGDSSGVRGIWQTATVEAVTELVAAGMAPSDIEAEIVGADTAPSDVKAAGVETEAEVAAI